MKVTIKVLKFQSFVYDTGMISNISTDQPVEVEVEKIGSNYHIMCGFNGVLIQVWSDTFKLIDNKDNKIINQEDLNE